MNSVHASAKALLISLHPLSRSQDESPFRAWCSGLRWWCLWTSLPFLMASTLLPSESGVLLLVAPHFVALSLVALLPHFVIGWTTLLSPLASVHTTCCQVLAVNSHLCRSLAHLSASSHHMLDCGDIDLFFGSPRSPPGGPPPNGIGGCQLEPRCSHRRCNSCMVVAGLFSLNA
jgi:hypothetical protein